LKTFGRFFHRDISYRALLEFAFKRAAFLGIVFWLGGWALARGRGAGSSYSPQSQFFRTQKHANKCCRGAGGSTRCAPVPLLNEDIDNAIHHPAVGRRETRGKVASQFRSDDSGPAL